MTTDKCERCNQGEQHVYCCHNCEKFAAEIAVLSIEKRDLKAAYDEEMKAGLELDSQREAANLQVRKLQEKLERYGQHYEDCGCRRSGGDGHCSCGLTGGKAMNLEAVGAWNGKDKPCGCEIIILEQKQNPFKLKLDIHFCKIHAEAEAALLQLHEVPKKLLEAVLAEQDRCAKIAEAFWNGADKLNADLRADLTQAEKNMAYLISTNIRALRRRESDFAEKPKCDHYGDAGKALTCQVCNPQKPKSDAERLTTISEDACQVIRGDGLHCWLPRPCPSHEKDGEVMEKRKDVVTPGLCRCGCHVGGIGSATACGCCSYNT